jgi:peptidoglycan/xylan/chitin deacetylase (PgdA/CDA1 family)
MFITSIDVDVGSRELGVINRGENDPYVRKHMSEYRVGEIDEVALPLLIDILNDLEIPVTFAIRGQLTEVNGSVFELLVKSPVKHDIGAHGYYHRQFKDLSQEEAENELNLISLGMKKFGIVPRSFVFPRNSVAHLNLLEKYGYKCYRSYSNFMNNCMYIEKKGRLYDVHPSLYLGQSISSVFLRKIVDVAVTKKLPFHIWFHPWNLGETYESIQRSVRKVFFPLLSYAKKKERIGELTFETMLSATERHESLALA